MLTATGHNEDFESRHGDIRTGACLRIGRLGVALVVAALMVVAGCGDDDAATDDAAPAEPGTSEAADDGGTAADVDEAAGDTEPSDASDESSTGDAEPEATTVPETPTDEGDGEATSDDASAGAGGEPPVGQPLEAMAVTTGMLGTPTSFSVGVPWQMAAAGRGAFVIAEPDATGPGGPSMSVFRATGFATLEQLTAEPPSPVFGGDFDTWLTHPGVEVLSQPAETVVGGRMATVVELRLVDPDPWFGPCNLDPDSRCIFFASTPDNGQLRAFVATTGAVSRIWVIDQEEHPPLVVLASAPEAQRAWVDETFAEVVASMMIDGAEPAP